MNQSWIRYLPSFLRQKVEGRAYLQNVLSNTGWQFADHVLRMGFGLLIGIWVARYLGPEQYGLLSYALAFATLFLPFTSLGLEEILVRTLVQDPDAREEALGTAFVLKLFGSLLAVILPTAYVCLLAPTDRQGQLLVAIVVLGNLFQAANVIESWFHSQVQAKYVAFARSSAFVVCAIIKIILILGGASLRAFALVATLELLLCALGWGLAYAVKNGSPLRWRPTRACAGKLLRDSWPLFFTNISVIIYQRIDQVMLMEMTGRQEVGIYSVAVRLTEVWVFIPTVLFWALFPSILEAKQSNEALFYERLQKFYNLMVFIAYAIAVPMTLVAPWLVRGLFGEAYARAGVLLATLIWANVFWSLEMARGAFLTSMNWNRFYLLTVLLACLLNIGLNYLLIPVYGGMGAVAASILAYWFAAHGSCFLARPLFRTGGMLTRALLYPKIW